MATAIRAPTEIFQSRRLCLQVALDNENIEYLPILKMFRPSILTIPVMIDVDQYCWKISVTANVFFPFWRCRCWGLHQFFSITAGYSLYWQKIMQILKNKKSASDSFFHRIIKMPVMSFIMHTNVLYSLLSVKTLISPILQYTGWL